MENFKRPTVSLIRLAVAFVSFTAILRAGGAETNLGPGIDGKQPTNSPLEGEVQLRAYLKLQEQLHGTLLAIEQARAESSLETQTNADALATRLEALERTLNQQRDQQFQSLHESNRTMLLLAGVIAGLGLLALTFAAFMQSRGMNRLAEIATAMPRDSLVPLPAGAASERLLLGPGGNGPTNKNLAATIQQLEDRLRELEQTAHPALPSPEPGPSVERRAQKTIEIGGPIRGGDHVSVLLGKGQVLLSLGQAENALACFDDVIVQAPNHAEAHVKKGMALERLKRLDEAIACYDRAIALNRSLTQAYLAKGGIFNRQERYAEALECYEQALRSEARS
jgi:tetratricopeptide (TPR) repeat protein